MKLTKLSPLALATAIALGGIAAPGIASAELGYNATVSSMYLWRGQDSSNGPTVSGGIDYSHDSGAYASVWTSSGLNGTAAGGGYETDVWFGYAGAAGDMAYDVSYWFIEYPQNDPATDAINEIILSLSYDAFSLGLTSGDDGYLYTTLGYGMGDFGATYGMSKADKTGGAGDQEYSHFDISYSATSELSFAISFPMDDSGAKRDVAIDPLMMMSYSLPISAK